MKMENNLCYLRNTELNKYVKVFLRIKLKELGLNVIDFKLDDADIYYKLKVKSIRKADTGYIKIKKKDVDVEDNSLFIAAILFFYTGISKSFLIPAVDLTNNNELCRNRDYPNMKSTPEWG
jgi:hypothetical protein